jgi:ubiquinone/menaquinone biosynthesis C-methylase UbiE
VNDHAEYVRAEWRRYHEQGAPLAALASRIVPGARLALDVGCGAGQELLPYLGATAVGIDPQRSGLVAGRALFEESGLRAPALLQGAAETLPFAGAAFDVVICRLALPYAGVRRALAEMARVLRPGGALVLQIHHLRYYLRQARRAQDLRELSHALRVIANGVVFQLTGLQPGETFLLLGTLGRRLAEAGIEVVEIDERDRAAPIVLARRRP